MPKGAKGIFESFRAGATNQDEAALSFMFPYQDHFRRLQMLTRHQQRSMVSMSVLGLFRRMYHSPTLTILQEELGLNKIALDGLGRAEGSEIVAARRAAREKAEED